MIQRLYSGFQSNCQQTFSENIYELDILFEWIPYNQFNNIKEKCKTVYSASWKDGPLKYDSNNKMLARVQAREVTLKLCNSQNMINDFLNKV